METKKRMDALLDAGLTAEALHDLGPAVTRLISALADLEHDLLRRPSVPTAHVEQRAAMNRNLRHLLTQAAVTVQNALVEIRDGVAPAIPDLIIIHPDRHAAHHAVGLAAFVDQCAKLVDAVETYVDMHVQAGLDAVGNALEETPLVIH